MATLEQIKAAGGYVPPNPLAPSPQTTAQTLDSGVNPLSVPPVNNTPLDSSIASSAVNSVLADYTNLQNQTTKAEQDLQTTGTKKLDIMSMLAGETADTQAANTATGVDSENNQLNNYVSQLATLNAQAQSLNREAQAIPIANQQRVSQQGSAGTENQVFNANYDQLAQNALKSLSIAQQSDIAYAAATGSNLRLQAAKDKAKQIVDLKYAPIKAALAREEEQYKQNKDYLESISKKKADALAVAISKDKAETDKKAAQELREENARIEKEKNLNALGTKLGELGVDGSIIDSVLSAKTYREALKIAGSNMRDPKAKYEIEKMRTDELFKEAQLAKVLKETSLLGEPSVAEKKEIAKALKEAKASIPVMKDKIDAVDVLVEHGGMNTRVGSSALSRGTFGPALATGAAGAAAGSVVPGFGTLVGGVGGFILGAAGGTKDKLTGKGQDFAGGVHKLTAGLTIQELQQAKAAGATFGSLTDGERLMLAAAATKLNDWEIKDDKGVGTGFWNIDEKSFKKELKTIQDLTRRAVQQSSGLLFNSEESSTLDEMYPEVEALPMSYFGEGNPLAMSKSRQIIPEMKEITKLEEGIVGGVNLKGYAVDPNQIKAVGTLYNKVPDSGNESDYDNYIKTVSPKSKVTGRNILNVADKFELDPKILVALIQHESGIGTSPVALANNNFGGITWSASYQAAHPGATKGTPRPAKEGGYYVKFSNVESGLAAQAQLLSKRKLS